MGLDPSSAKIYRISGRFLDQEEKVLFIYAVYLAWGKVQQEDHLVLPHGTRNFHLSGDSGFSSKSIVILIRKIWWSTSDQHYFGSKVELLFYWNMCLLHRLTIEFKSKI